jgi:anti-anti-sigma factor
VHVHRIRVERDGDGDGAVGVVRATGELDAFAVPDLEGAFAELVALDRVVVDLEGVSFLDSTALGTLVHQVRRVQAHDGAEVRVVLPDGTARRIFEITTLDRVLPVAPSVGAALAELAR